MSGFEGYGVCSQRVCSCTPATHYLPFLKIPEKSPQPSNAKFRSKPVSPRRIRQVRKLLDKIYSKIPEIDCKKSCGNCCGPIMWNYAEWLVVTDWLKQHGRPVLMAKSLNEDCPYLDADKKCTIYEVRPIICRLFGVVDTVLLKCPYVGAEKVLSEKQAGKLQGLVEMISRDLFTMGKITHKTRNIVEKTLSEF